MNKNKTYPWNHSRRFNAYTQMMIKRFGGRFQKVTVDAGFTCPNRDGAKGRGGCSYCDNNSFNPTYNKPENPVMWQIKNGIEFHENRYRKAKKYLVYFQPYSNTYAPLADLKKLYEEALSFPDVVGLAIGTRPDCVDDAKLDYLAALNEDYFISIEYGIESCYDKTLARINRGHSFEDSVNAIQKSAERGLHVGSHMIFGLPGETKEMMLDEAAVISALPVSSVKFHQLQLIKGKDIIRDYEENKSEFHVFKLDEYIDFIIEFVRRLNPEIAIERFAGEVPPEYLYLPPWGNLRYDQILNRIEKRMEELDAWQGQCYQA